MIANDINDLDSYGKVQPGQLSSLIIGQQRKKHENKNIHYNAPAWMVSPASRNCRHGHRVCGYRKATRARIRCRTVIASPVRQKRVVGRKIQNGSFINLLKPSWRLHL
ncbi:hypothetical protein [Desulfosarcina widdelii]|uniref:hypothetical protein n=1 Tax=Desulfosarcina widdelii TaxID=947919 RepID=UPI0012D321C3|nr:hypothetical protein [Desulfosarcina widdelii]